MKNKDIEEDIKQLESLKLDRESFVIGDEEHDKIYLKDIQAIENVLADRERYKKLAEQNLKDSEEFKNNMCKHRCIKNNEILELQAKANKYDSLVEKIKEKLNEEKLPLTIVGGRRNSKILNYGIKLGRTQMLEELIKEEGE